MTDVVSDVHLAYLALFSGRRPADQREEPGDGGDAGAATGEP